MTAGHMTFDLRIFRRVLRILYLLDIMNYSFNFSKLHDACSLPVLHI